MKKKNSPPVNGEHSINFSHAINEKNTQLNYSMGNTKKQVKSRLFRGISFLIYLDKDIKLRYTIGVKTHAL